MIYSDGYENACTKCGSRFSLSGIEKAPEVNFIVEQKKKQQNRHKVQACINCERLKRNTRKGLCAGCYYAVRNLIVGSNAYIKALADFKERLNNPSIRKEIQKRSAKWVFQK
jgi:hypothetical protein